MKIRIRSTVDILLLGGTCKNVELALRESKAGHSVLIATPYSYFGDDICATFDFHAIPDFLRKLNIAGIPTPMTVKRTLDRLVIQHDIPFAFQTFALAKDEDCVILADRDSVYAVRAHVIIDDTPLHHIARQSQMRFDSFVPGTVQALYRYLKSCETSEADYICEERPYRIEEKNIAVQLDNLTPDCYFSAVLEARRKSWERDHALIADRIIFPQLSHLAGEDSSGRVFLPENYRGFQGSQNALSSRNELEYTPIQQVKYDIAIAGGGTAGAAAGLPGAQAGLRTLVIERLSHLGGTGTQGCIGSYWFGLKIGYTHHLDEQVKEYTGAPAIEYCWQTEDKQHTWEMENGQAGVSVWLDSFCFGTECSDAGVITSLLVATPFGGVKVNAQQFIDCTGNAELAFHCGAPTHFSDELEPAYQGCGMNPVMPGKGYINTDYLFIVDSDTTDVARAFICGRNRFPDKFDLSQLPGTRERRRIIGEIVLKATDFYANRQYHDTVCIASSDFDTHGFTVDPLLIFHPTDSNPFIASIPFRAFLSPGISNLMSTGLGLSAQRDAMPLIRMIADVQNQGFVAGLLAAEAVKCKTELRNIDLPKIQRSLQGMGFLTPDQEIPIPELNTDAQIFSFPDIKALKEDFATAPTFEKGIRLAFLGSDAGVPLLKRTIQNTLWDDGWDYRGMGQAGRATSRLDAAIMALNSFDCNDLSFLIPRLHEMTVTTHFSHYRAVCLFLMKHPFAGAEEDLNRLLTSFPCHAITTWKDLLDSPYVNPCDVEERNLQLRELYLASALHACAPHNKLARDFLDRYANGLVKLYAIFAKKWNN